MAFGSGQDAFCSAGDLRGSGRTYTSGSGTVAETDKQEGRNEGIGTQAMSQELIIWQQRLAGWEG